MLPLIYTSPVAAGLFLVTCLVWLVPETFGTRRQMAKFSRKGDQIKDHGSFWILVGLQWTGLVLNFTLAWFLPSAAIPWPRIFLFVLAEAILLLGVFLRWRAIRVLGGYFTRDVSVSSDQKIIQEGPYRFIRHPAYSGTFLTMCGVGLAAANWVGLIVLLFCIFIGHFYRVTIEEKALVRTIGKPYLDYMRRTKRFIPWIF